MSLGPNRLCAVLVAVGACVLATGATADAARAAAPWDPARGLLIEGATVVTMDDRHTVIPHGRVLVRNGRIVAVWRGPTAPAGVAVGEATVIEAGPQDLVFPGLINLHSHPVYNHLHAWPAPSSHAIPAQAKAGTDPYANRYQWGGAGPPTAPPSTDRLVSNPAGRARRRTSGSASPARSSSTPRSAALLGGETAIQGAPPNPESDGVLIRNVDNDVFDDADRAAAGQADRHVRRSCRSPPPRTAWRPARSTPGWCTSPRASATGDRRPGDTVSSRAELDTLRAKGLLTDMTVIIHGTALERSDFADMRAAPTIRSDGIGDGRGAKLVWSPLSNLLLYGETANVYEALAEDVLVSLGTDWTPSGSRTLLQELKVADAALRDVRLLGRKPRAGAGFRARRQAGARSGSAPRKRSTRRSSTWSPAIPRSPCAGTTGSAPSRRARSPTSCSCVVHAVARARVCRRLSIAT